MNSSTTLTELYLHGEDKNNTQMTSINNPLFSIFIKSTDNRIGESGTTSLSDALKSNTTLTELYMSGEDTRNNAQMTSINNQLFSILIKYTVSMFGDKGATSLSEALKSNTTLEKLDLSREDKRNNTQVTSISNPLSSIIIK